MGIKIKKAINKIKSDKKTKLLALLGIFAIVFLFISEISGGGDRDVKEKENKSFCDISSYSDEIENKLENIISSIEGAGKTNVMVTIDTSEENIYAKESKNNSEDKENNSKNSSEYEYVIIKTASSKEEGLLLKVTQPDVRGVAIVCAGADIASVRESIINTVSSVLDIKKNKISISKMKE